MLSRSLLVAGVVALALSSASVASAQSTCSSNTTYCIPTPGGTVNVSSDGKTVQLPFTCPTTSPPENCTGNVDLENGGVGRRAAAAAVVVLGQIPLNLPSGSSTILNITLSAAGQDQVRRSANTPVNVVLVAPDGKQTVIEAVTLHSPRSILRRTFSAFSHRSSGRHFRRITTSGRLGLPANLSRSVGCTGNVLIVVKSGSRTVSARTTRLHSNCRYSSTVTFHELSRVRHRLHATARFLGNSALKPKIARGG